MKPLYLTFSEVDICCEVTNQLFETDLRELTCKDAHQARWYFKISKRKSKNAWPFNFICYPDDELGCLVSITNAPKVKYPERCKEELIATEPLSINDRWEYHDSIVKGYRYMYADTSEKIRDHFGLKGFKPKTLYVSMEYEEWEGVS